MIYAFAEFEIDDALLELRYRGDAQRVPPRVLKTLLHLLRNRARAVSRDELVDVIGGGLAVSDAGLNQTIMLARQATHDEGDRPTIIQSVRPDGFRFVAAVSEIGRQTACDSAALEPARETLFGRSHELAALLAQLESAQRGRGSLVLLHGAPGIGKTRLAEALCARAIERGSAVFWGRCWEDGGAPALWPFVQVLRAIHAQFGSERVRSWLDDRSSELLRLVPELAPGRVPTARDPSADAAQAQFRVFDALARMLRRMAQALHQASADRSIAPAVVIALEDLHAADDTSLHFLRFLSPDLRAARLLLIGTFRELEVSEPGAIATLLGAPLENTLRLPLNGLLRPDVAQYAERLLGRAVATRMAEPLHELSSGNPFLIGELARFSRGELELSALSRLRVPERMAEAVHRRLDGMPAATRELLELAAVLGPEFPLRQLRAVAARSDVELLDDLDPALRTSTLEALPNSREGRVRFVHALVRDTLYRELPLVRRLALHRKVAEALEADPAGGDLPLYELAHHFQRALAGGGSVRKAIDYALKAAERAEQALAFETEARLRDRALELDAESSKAPQTHWDRLLRAGHAWYAAGALDKATARYSRAAEYARDRGHVERFAGAVWLCIQVQRGFTLFNPQLLALIDQALHMLPEGDSRLRALLLGFRGVGVHRLGEPAERDAATREAVEMARRLADDGAIGVALICRRWLMNGAIHPAQGREIASEVLVLARRIENAEGELDGLFWRMQAHLELGDVALADRDRAAYKLLAERKRHAQHRYWAALFEAMRCTWSGDFATAAERSDAALSWGQRIQAPFAAGFHALQAWYTRILKGGSDEIPPSLATLWAPEGTLVGRAIQLFARGDEGSLEEARSSYETLARDDFAGVLQSPLRRSVLAVLSARCAQFDDRARAKRLYELLLPDADLHVLLMASWVYLGPVSEYLALLASCFRDYGLATAHFERALVQCERFGARPQLARIRHEYAQTLPATPGAPTGGAAELSRRASAAGEQFGTAQRWPLSAAVLRELEDET